ncbi:hypothetical protein H4J45_17340 [Colwellia sp. BRX10-6]|uniref:hypothetical protein n=1 Tax=unclassified Colwellia TaxID=196834 RepID=UPI0015F3FFA7|nr:MULTISPECIES: hypothetical protein [unclassified Colwellia]MBA6383428.1 hypothetical protein [Colwellia sp. BRX10-9]MBA6395851.1 hypothetical protein [Colwellia sp. BRX10-6]
MIKGFLFCILMLFTIDSVANSFITLSYEGKEYTLTNVNNPQDFSALDKENNVLVENVQLATELYVGLQSYNKVMSSNLSLESPDTLEALKIDVQESIVHDNKISETLKQININASLILDVNSVVLDGIGDGLKSFADTVASTIISNDFSTVREVQIATAYAAAVSESQIYTASYNMYQDMKSEHSKSIESALILEDFFQDAKGRYNTAEAGLNILKYASNQTNAELLVLIGNIGASFINRSTIYTVITETLLTINQTLKLNIPTLAINLAPLELPNLVVSALEKLIATSTFINRGYEFTGNIEEESGVISGSSPEGSIKNIEFNTIYNYGTGEFTVVLSKEAKEMLEAEGYTAGNGLDFSELLEQIQLLVDNGMVLNPLSQTSLPFDYTQVFDDANFSTSGLLGLDFESSFTSNWFTSSHSGSMNFSLNNDSLFIQGSSDFENETLNLITGSPVSIDQYFAWEDSAFLSFDYLFEDEKGVFDVFANGETIFSIDGDTASNGWNYEEIWLDLDLNPGDLLNLQFKFDDIVSGSNLLLDNIKFTNLVNGDFSQNLYVWNTKGEGKAKIIDNAELITVPEPPTYFIFILGCIFILYRHKNIINENCLLKYK